MNRIFIMIATLGLFAIQGCQAQEPGKPPATPSSPASATTAATPVSVKDISGDEYLKMKGSRTDLQLLDVRTPEEIAGGYIEGAAKINIYDSDFAEKVEKNLVKTQPIVVYCKAGGRSARAADILAQKGFTEVYNITGGITAWMTEGKPTVK